MNISELRKICQKSSSSPSAASQTIWGQTNRFFSVYLTRIFINTKVTPNQITTLGSTIFIAGCGLFMFNTTTYNLLGFGMIVFAYILDASDGELARYRRHQGLTSKYDLGGVYVEPTSHDTQYGFMLVPMGYGAMLATGSALPLVAAAFATIAKLMFRLLEFRYMAAARHIDEVQGATYGWKQNVTTPTTFAYRLYRNLSTVTGMMPLILLAIIVDRIDIFLYAYAVLFMGLWAYKFARNINKIAEKLPEESVGSEPKMILFDFDGTLVDTMHGYADLAADIMHETYGTPHEVAHGAYMHTSGLPYCQQLEVIYPGDERNAHAEARFEKEKMAIMWATSPDSDFTKVIDALNRRGITAVVSSNNTQDNITAYVQKMDMPFKEALGFKEGFAKGRDHVEHLKRIYNISEDDMLFVGDSFSDAKKALSLNIRFVARTGTNSQEAFIRKFPNIHVIHSLSDLLKLL